MKTHPMFSTKLSQADSLRMELKIATICREMGETGFPLDVEETNKQIGQLSTRIDFVDKWCVPEIPPSFKKNGATVEKIYKINGDYTKQVVDWLEDSYPRCATISIPSVTIGSRLVSISNDVSVGASFNRLESVSINLGSDKQVKAWLLRNGWIPTEWNYKKVNGREVRNAFGDKIKTSPKITLDSLDSLHGLGVLAELIGYRFKIRHKRSQLEGFLRNLRPDGRVPSLVNTLGTVTRRMTHSKIANVPSPKKGALWKTMRRVFYAPKGYKIVGCDASQIQVRGLAHYAWYFGERDFIELLYAADRGEGDDVHTANGKRAGVTRNESKGIFYGYLFGSGIAKTAAQLGKTVPETEAIRKKFDKAVPFVSKIVKELKKFWKSNGYILGIAGNKIYVDYEHMLLVYFLQDYEQFIMKTAICYMYDAFKREGLDTKLVTIQHDEVQLLTADKDVARVSEIAEESIAKASRFVGSHCDNVGCAEVGNNWYETH